MRFDNAASLAASEAAIDQYRRSYQRLTRENLVAVMGDPLMPEESAFVVRAIQALRRSWIAEMIDPDPIRRDNAGGPRPDCPCQLCGRHYGRNR